LDLRAMKCSGVKDLASLLGAKVLSRGKD